MFNLKLACLHNLSGAFMWSKVKGKEQRKVPRARKRLQLKKKKSFIERKMGWVWGQKEEEGEK